MSRFSVEGTQDVKRDEAFYSDHIVFQVDKTLFKVPKRKFEQESQIFRDTFALPTSESNLAEGTSDEHPLVLEGIAESDFRAFLKVMFRPHYGPSKEEESTLSLPQWISVLKLSTMWQFATLRTIAISAMKPLLEIQGGSAQWVSLARTYGVRDWLLPALQALARRDQPLQLSEVELLGIETVIKVAEIRESFCNSITSKRGHRYGSSSTGRASWSFDREIMRLFNDEVGDGGVVELPEFDDY